MLNHPKESIVKRIENKSEYLTIYFSQTWDQDDITILVEQLLAPHSGIKIQEHNLGADREDVRFSWDNHFFILNFDCYSQSCWIEGQDILGTEHLSALYLALSTMNKH